MTLTELVEVSILVVVDHGRRPAVFGFDPVHATLVSILVVVDHGRRLAPETLASMRADWFQSLL